MKFGRIPVHQAEGWLLAHSLMVFGRKWKKGKCLTKIEVEALQGAGFKTIVAGRLEANDVDENSAAEAMARVLAGDGVEVRPAATGRCNLYSTERGLVKLRMNQIDRVNSVDEALTVATLPPYSSVYPGRLLVSVKIITFGVNRDLLDTCIGTIASGMPAVTVRPFESMRIGLIQTYTKWFNQALLVKGSHMLQERAEMVGSAITVERTCDHHEDAVFQQIRSLMSMNLDLILVLGASAIQDREDVIPQGIVSAGGRIEHFGMPVDPGNLLLLAKCEKTAILGLPGCVRSPKRNGFDFVFERLAAGMEVLPDDIMNMGTSGILTEPSRRPVRRTPAVSQISTDSKSKKITAVVLAAGQSRRMGDKNKLFLTMGEESIIQKVVNNLKRSKVDNVVVVTGYESEKVVNELSDLSVRFVHNPEYSQGLSTSLRTALANLSQDISGVLVCLGDMPFVNSWHIDKLIDAFDPVTKHSICIPTYKGKRGNPVLWDRRYFQEMMELRGDVGAKHMIGDYEESVIEIEIDDIGVVTDFDTPEAYAKLGECTIDQD